MRTVLIVLAASTAAALRLPSTFVRLPSEKSICGPSSFVEHVSRSSVKFAAAATLSALLVVQPVQADTASAAKDLTDAIYPILGDLKKDKVAPLASKAVGVALTASPREIIKTVDAARAAFCV